MHGLRPSITPEEVNALPIRRYEGEVRLVETAEELERAAAAIGAAGVVGFDTETRPAFRPGESYLPCLAQVATADTVYLFRLQERDCSAAIAAMLAAPGVCKAGVALADDLRQLKKLFPFEENGVVDLGVLGKRHGLKQSGVRNLAALALGFRIPKGSKTSNWAAARLTPQHRLYAATDAWICRELYLEFRRLGLA